MRHEASFRRHFSVTEARSKAANAPVPHASSLMPHALEVEMPEVDIAEELAEMDIAVEAGDARAYELALMRQSFS